MWHWSLSQFTKNLAFLKKLDRLRYLCLATNYTFCMSTQMHFLFNSCPNALDVTPSHEPPPTPPEGLAKHMRRFAVSTFQFLENNKKETLLGEKKEVMVVKEEEEVNTPPVEVKLNRLEERRVYFIIISRNYSNAIKKAHLSILRFILCAPPRCVYPLKVHVLRAVLIVSTWHSLIRSLLSFSDHTTYNNIHHIHFTSTKAMFSWFWWAADSPTVKSWVVEALQDSRNHSISSEWLSCASKKENKESVWKSRCGQAFWFLWMKSIYLLMNV